MTDMRKKNHLTFRDDLSMFDNFFQSRDSLVAKLAAVPVLGLGLALFKKKKEDY